MQRGAAATSILDDYLQHLGYRTAGGPLAQSLVINALTVKVKSSMLWSSGHFKFQQIEDDPYDHLAFFGIEPTDAWLWIITKHAALSYATGQHKKDSKWIEFKRHTPPPWLGNYGGPIANGAATVLQALGHP